MTSDARLKIEPTTDDDLEGACAFLHANLDDSLSMAAWRQVFATSWTDHKPNNGFMLRAGGAIVGTIGAIYSDQIVRGQTERFCNVTSWCVQPEHRGHSIRLLRQLIDQPGYHYTAFTPSPHAANLFRAMKFRPIDNKLVAVPNLLLPGRACGLEITADSEQIAHRLDADAAKCWRDHIDFPVLQHLALGRDGAYCHVVYTERHKYGLRYSRVLYVSDRALFARCLDGLRGYLFWRGGSLATAMPWRWLAARPVLGRTADSPRIWLFRSPTLDQDDICALYSELLPLGAI